MKYACNTIELQKVLIEKGIRTIVDLSERTSINRNTLGDVLSGKRQPSYITMTKLVESLELNSEQAGQIFFKPDLRTT